MLKRLILFALALIVLSHGTAADYCDRSDNWFPFENLCFRQSFDVGAGSQGANTWEYAELDCEGRRGTLINIYDQDTFDLVNDPDIFQGHFWVGLRKDEGESDFRWPNGERATIKKEWWADSIVPDYSKAGCVRRAGSQGNGLQMVNCEGYKHFWFCQKYKTPGYPPEPITGIPGRPGPKGLPGPAGPPGAPGKDGLTGPPSPPGPMGPVGPTGQSGENGNPGSPGVIGLPGTQGRDGKPGNSGKDGNPGSPGNPGKDGAPGKPGVGGAPGNPGSSGKDGNDGSPGNDGRPGANGERGPPGINGVDGRPGPPGSQGPPSLPHNEIAKDNTDREQYKVAQAGSKVRQAFDQMQVDSSSDDRPETYSYREYQPQRWH